MAAWAWRSCRRQTAAYLLGARLHGFTSISPLYSGCGLMFSASTYADTVGLTFFRPADDADPESCASAWTKAVAAVAQLKVGKPAGAKPGGQTAGEKAPDHLARRTLSAGRYSSRRLMVRDTAILPSSKNASWFSSIAPGRRGN